MRASGYVDPRSSALRAQLFGVDDISLNLLAVKGLSRRAQPNATPPRFYDSTGSYLLGLRESARRMLARQATPVDYRRASIYRRNAEADSYSFAKRKVKGLLQKNKLKDIQQDAEAEEDDDPIEPVNDDPQLDPDGDAIERVQEFIDAQQVVRELEAFDEQQEQQHSIADSVENTFLDAVDAVTGALVDASQGRISQHAGEQRRQLAIEEGPADTLRLGMGSLGLEMTPAQRYEQSGPEVEMIDAMPAQRYRELEMVDAMPPPQKTRLKSLPATFLHANRLAQNQHGIGQSRRESKIIELPNEAGPSRQHRQARITELPDEDYENERELAPARVVDPNDHFYHAGQRTLADELAQVKRQQKGKGRVMMQVDQVHADIAMNRFQAKRGPAPGRRG